MSSAHVFYLPIMIAVGFMVGFYAGRSSARQELEARKRAKRRDALEARKRASSASKEDE